MAAYTSLLLGIALCAATAYSLKCYTCDGASSNAACMTATNCSSNATFCQTQTGSISGLWGITKACVTSCTPVDFSFAGITSTTTCCSSDLCNTSGGATITSSYTAIILALGSILTVLQSSVL
ncbi:lymphocyte antigen 6E-like [Dendropsophus ebraccatus]|uniref:lymphocyte antigen 6E-like n=1 Tax=Dendropsophus ebraccatus TaxID=150705 RepID=UPI0038314D92